MRVKQQQHKTLKIFSLIHLTFFYAIALYFKLPKIDVDNEKITFNSNTAFFFHKIPYSTAGQIGEVPPNNIVTFKKYNHTREEKGKTYVKCGKGINDLLQDDRCDEDKLMQRSRILHATHYMLLNAYGNSYGSWAINQMFIYYSEKHYGEYYWTMFFHLLNGDLRCEINEVILTGHSHARNNYGHCIHDLLAPIVLMPREVRERSYVIGDKTHHFVHDGLLQIGFRKEQILDLGEKEWFYAKKIHVINDWRPLSTLSGDCIKMLMKEISNNLQLDKIDPTNYGLTNRQKSSKGRSISNFKELSTEIKKQFSEYMWIFIPDNFSSYKDAAKTWASFRFIFMPTGSNGFKCMYMKINTVLCIISSVKFDYYLNLFAISGQHFVYWIPTDMPHYSKNAYEININTCIEHLGKALYCDKNGHF